MAIATEQVTFLGASVSSFTGSLGWNSQPSQLIVKLVEDKSNGDKFIKPVVGTPQTFNFNGWVFHGIVQNWRENRSSEGFTFEVVLTDPSNILGGVELIINNFNGSINNVPNVLNVYGYLENQQFGRSGANDSGMPWANIRQAIQEITALPDIGLIPYGGPIKFRGSTYRVDLSKLPPLSLNYRVGGDNITFLDYINDVAEASSTDFFVTLEPTSIANNFVIQVHTISRLVQPEFNKINEFLQTVGGANTKNFGFEFRDDPTSKFVVGGNKEDIDIVYNVKSTKEEDGKIVEDDPLKHTIWPFWGYQANGNAVLGRGFGNQHTFTLDSRKVFTRGVGAFYTTDVEELRAVEDGQDSWEFFLIIKNDDEERDDGTPNPHFQKADKLGIIGPVSKNIGAFLKQLNIGNVQNWSFQQFKNAFINTGISYEEEIKRLYDWLKTYVDDYLGKQYMIKLNDLDFSHDSSLDVTTFSKEPLNAGFIAENIWNEAISRGLLPNNLHLLQNEEGKIEAYVKYNNLSLLDISDFDARSVIYDKNIIRDRDGEIKAASLNIFIKCEVQNDIIFIDELNKLNPRVVIKIPEKIRKKKTGTGWRHAGQLINWFNSHIKQGNITKEFLEKTIGHFGADQLFFGEAGLVVDPAFAAVPLRSNVDTYGPWFITGADGKTIFEKDESLVPWEYGGFQGMNAAANAKVTDALSRAQQFENGSITFAGAPNRTLGQALIGGGPFVTDISVQVGADGVTTTYKMQTWTPNFGKLSKANADRIQKLSLKSQRDRRDRRQRSKERSPFDIGFKKREYAFTKSRRRKPFSSNHIIAGDYIINEDSGVQSNVVIQPAYHTISQLGTNYTQKAAASLDSLFRPFSTNPDEVNLPRFENPSGNATTPTVNDLNPFASGHDISITLRGQEIPDHLATTVDGYRQSHDTRALALKAPLILTGFGYDTAGNPLASGTDKFNMKNWKTGPLDARWDNERKVYVAGGGDVKLVKITNAGVSGIQRVHKADEYKVSFQSSGDTPVTLTSLNRSLFVGNFRQVGIIEGAFYLAHQVGGKYVIDNQAVFQEFM